MPDPAAPRTVRVVCPDCPGGKDRWPECGRCDPDGTISLGLLDPAAEALMADGERYAKMLAAVRATITKLDAVFRYINAGPITLAHVHGVSYNGPTTEPEYGALKALATTPPAEARNG